MLRYACGIPFEQVVERLTRGEIVVVDVLDTETELINEYWLTSISFTIHCQVGPLSKDNGVTYWKSVSPGIYRLADFEFYTELTQNQMDMLLL